MIYLKFFILSLFIINCLADNLWNKAVDIYGKYLNNRPNPHKTYLLMEAGGSKGINNSNEIWEEYKFENSKAFRKILKMKKNGIEIEIPENAKDKWLPVDGKTKDIKSDYKGMDKIFFKENQNDVKLKKTGNTKTIYKKECIEYSYELKQLENNKNSYLKGNVYLDKNTGAPYEITRIVDGQMTVKNHPEQFVKFSYDGISLYPRHLYLYFEINMFGKISTTKVEAKLEYTKTISD
jgi:hypothetical protein